MGPEYSESEALAHLKAQDEALGQLIDAAGPLSMGINEERTVFEALLRSIVYQQLSGRAAATIYSRVLEVIGEVQPSPEGLLRLTDVQLRAAGLSRAKALAAVDLAERTLRGEVPDGGQMQRMTDEEIVEQLVSIRGVGPWTAQMLLIFHLGRPDVLPVTDLGVRKGLMITYGLDQLPTIEILTTRAAIWRPYRSVASWYMWRALDLATGTPPPSI